VPVKSSEAIASSIEFLLNDRSLLEEIGSAARKKVLTSFDINKTVDTYSSLFEEILRQKAV
jgi:glycosyltransferase involved in cell wall biosynthesis